METVTIFTSGVSRGNPGAAAIGVYITDATGTVIKETAETIGNANDNFAEYYAVMRGLQIAVEHFDTMTNNMQFEVALDSELVQKQLSGTCQIKEPGLVPYFIEIHNMKVASFPHLSFTRKSREQNAEAVRLVDEALDAYTA